MWSWDTQPSKVTYQLSLSGPPKGPVRASREGQKAWAAAPTQLEAGRSGETCPPHKRDARPTAFKVQTRGRRPLEAAGPS